MNKKSLKTKLLLSVVIICQVLLIRTVSGVAQESEIRVTIKGKISNIDDAGAYINAQTCLQLYPCETTGKMNVEVDQKGKIIQAPGQTGQTIYLDGFNRMVPPSPLPRVGLPVFGTFIFSKVRGLEPGRCYKICVMMLDQQYPGMVSLATGDGKPLEIIIPAVGPGENSDKIVVDLTKESLLIPELLKR